MNPKSEFERDVYDHIYVRLWDFEGFDTYPCDLTHELTLNENYNGCWIGDQKTALEFICNNPWQASETFDYCQDLDMRVNPFDNPAAYTFYMLYYGVDKLLSESEYLTENWNEQITLTPDVIETITKEINEVTHG